MKKIFQFLGAGKAGEGNAGIINLIREKTGKVSFKRSVPILLLTMVVAPDVATNGLTWMNIAVIAIAGGIYVLPKIFSRDSE